MVFPGYLCVFHLLVRIKVLVVLALVAVPVVFNIGIGVCGCLSKILPFCFLKQKVLWWGEMAPLPKKSPDLGNSSPVPRALMYVRTSVHHHHHHQDEDDRGRTRRG
jgi:hypothetical protein